MVLRSLHDRIPILNAEGITDSSQGASATDEVPKLTVAVKIDGADDNVIMDVGFVDMGANDKGVPALCEAHSQLMASPGTKDWRR